MAQQGGGGFDNLRKNEISLRTQNFGSLQEFLHTWGLSSWYGEPEATLVVRAVEDGILANCSLDLDSNFSATISRLKKKNSRKAVAVCLALAV
jgi:hypothetical protein